MNTDPSSSADLPIKCNLTLLYAVSLVIAVLLVVLSAAGLLYPNTIYPTDELLQSFVPNDAVNLLIGLPILLASMWLTRRDRLVGLLLWPGALFFVFYTYLVYLFSMPPNLAFLAYLVLVVLSSYALIGVLSCSDAHAVQDKLAGAVPERAAGAVLAVLGTLFILRVVVVLGGAIFSQSPIPQTDLALYVVDFLLSPAWVIGGVLLWRRQAVGYLTGLGLLFQASMLFIGLIFILIIQPFLASTQFSLVDVLVVFVMGMVCFVPLVLFIRGVRSITNLPSAE